LNIYRFSWGIRDDAQVWVVHLGSKSTPLIAQQYREVGVQSRILGIEEFRDEVKAQGCSARMVTLSGSPSGVYEEGAPYISRDLIDQLISQKVVILGICYGAQLLAHLYKGKVLKGNKVEYGPTPLTLSRGDFGEYQGGTVVMNHGDEVVTLPPGWKHFGSTASCPNALFGKERIICTQWHPEMGDTVDGDKFLAHLVYTLAGCEKDYTFDPRRFEDEAGEFMRQNAKGRKLLVGLSGGVDSSSAFMLAKHAVGEDGVVAVVVNNGYMREGEFEWLQKIFPNPNVRFVDASEKFYKAVAEIPWTWGNDPWYYDQIRLVIGTTFISVFEETVRDLGEFVLVQGTNYSDIIETITGLKRHHNVGGLPEDMAFDVLEPLAGLYKHEIRKIAEHLGLPQEIVWRQPFPGPGNAIRAWGKMTPEVARVLARANRILEEVVWKHYPSPQTRPHQYYVSFVPLKTRGFMGDKGCDGFMFGVRAVISGRETYATVRPFWFSPEVFAEIEWRLTTEVQMPDGTPLVRVLYDFTHKPPATTEPH
jgi:GMP synthase (glutamine-hydrolysing)